MMQRLKGGVTRHLGEVRDSRPWRIAIVATLAALFVVDVRVPLGFNTASLYLPVVFAAIFTGNRRFVMGTTAAAMALVLIGIPFAPPIVPGGSRVLVAVNRGIAFLGIAGCGALAVALLRAVQEYAAAHASLTRAQEALQQKNHLLQVAGEACSIGGWTVELPGRRVTWSDEVARIHGKPAGYSPTLERAFDFYLPEQVADIRAAFEACATDGVPFDAEVQIVAEGGRRVWGRVVGQAVCNPFGIIQSVQGAFQDISERKEAEHTSRQAVQRLHRTLDSLTDGFVVIDQQWRFVYVNAAAERSVATGREALLGEVIWDRFPAMAGSIFEREYRRAMERKETAVFEAFYAPLDTWFEVNVYPAPEGLSIYFRDVTARRRAEAQLRLLETAVSRLNDIVLITEAEPIGEPGPRIVFVNEAFELRTGYKREEVLGRSPRFLQGPDTQRSELDRIRAAMEKWQPVRAELVNYRKSGQPFRLELDIVPIADESGWYTHWVSVERDVTARHALEEQLRRSQRLESVGQLTGGVAHDFNNLLTVILGNAELLQEHLAADPRLGALAAMVVDAAERGAQLTHHLLAFARKQPLAPQRVDLNAQVAELDALVRRTLGEHIEIRLVPGQPLWPAMVDPAQLYNALLNLCLNSRDAMPLGGRLTIETANARLDADSVRAHPYTRAGDYVMLAVSDTGVGIEAGHLGRVFEPFFTTKPGGKGTGLGLAMVYGFARQSGGHVDIYSEPGVGTTVKLYLPRAEGAELPPTLAPDGPQAAGGCEAILLVEDDALVRRYAHDQLVALGYRVIEAHHGAQALELLRGGAAVDLLFTDVVMPGMSGRQLAEQALRLRPGLKVLYTSGYTDNAIVHHGRLDPGVHLLTKPYRREELARRVRDALGAVPAPVRD